LDKKHLRKEKDLDRRSKIETRRRTTRADLERLCIGNPRGRDQRSEGEGLVGEAFFSFAGAPPSCGRKRQKKKLGRNEKEEEARKAEKADNSYMAYHAIAKKQKND